MPFNMTKFHRVQESPWPFSVATSTATLVSGVLEWLWEGNDVGVWLGLSAAAFGCTLWWRDVIREATFQGKHTKFVQGTIKSGMLLFIASEVMFFFSFFWAFLHCALSPSFEVGMVWPPLGIVPPNAWGLPFLNTTLLIHSGLTLTWASRAVKEGSKWSAAMGLLVTIILGVVFMGVQGLEWWRAPFDIRDSVYGSTFFMMTGLHGLHVAGGLMFIIVCLGRLLRNHFSTARHLGLSCAIWYWHFVDVVWILLWALVYVWGS
uniref:cytochrome c oxidase subunit III n=1 Tax=Patelloida saccharinoides TaxID=225156 RepID=UPI0023D7FC51|nr:cytochrome c oxidase subunit III [Patelloida saccharinoides]WCR50866.1 cytochrome c oxidase subunit 3 [Patelloida saccharinoides]